MQQKNLLIIVKKVIWEIKRVNFCLVNYLLLLLAASTVIQWQNPTAKSNQLFL